MNLLGIVQSIHQEAKLAGDEPTTTVSQTGRSGDLVRWAIEAWNDIQRENNGKWLWMLGDCYFDTSASDDSYAYGDVTDTDAASAITRFRSWHLDERERPLIYLSADGASTERELSLVDWHEFRFKYVRGTHTAAYPAVICSDFNENLRLGPTPDAVYRVTGNYWKSNQVLANNTDIPEMPTDYHMLIVYRALVKYGYNAISHEALARAEADGAPLWDALQHNQAYKRFSLTTHEALA